MKTLVFDKNFEILQDVLKNAEERGITKPEFNPINFAIMHNISEFEPLPRLAHLQLVYEKNPYYGRHLRFYNQAPWWYRLRFTVPICPQTRFSASELLIIMPMSGSTAKSLVLTRDISGHLNSLSAI